LPPTVEDDVDIKTPLILLKDNRVFWERYLPGMGPDEMGMGAGEIGKERNRFHVIVEHNSVCLSHLHPPTK
jgi:hypothetical protein